MRGAGINRIAVLQALTVLALVLPIVAGGTYLWGTHHEIQKSLTDLEPRYARLLGLVEQQAALKSLGDQASGQLVRLAYPASQDATQTGNDAQQRIRTLFADSRLDIVSIQVLPPPKGDSPFDRIQINLRVEGELVGLQTALSALATQTPRVLVDTVTLQTIGAVKPASIQRLGGEFNFTVLRVRS
jgi:general secretion pathway protein M